MQVLLHRYAYSSGTVAMLAQAKYKNIGIPTFNRSTANIVTDVLW